ncbi:MAG: creatininase [candidate division Zixibacteria bacterium HGW-Zixibacteria-1]|nr:MAG: creatininase [candidate division Zixibacteria bacterium HGW-Zixibacteria-1]
MQRELQKLTWKNVRELVPGKIDTVIFPVGTVEAHGVTVLGTDNLIPDSIALNLADKINAIIAPTLNYGITKSLYGYPGSMTVKSDSFQNFVFDILKSLRDVGFRKIIVLNGHGGNNTSLKTAAHDFYYEYRINTAIIHWWELCEDLVEEIYGEAGGHAGNNETAMIQAIDETLVDKSQLDDNMPYHYISGADIFPVPGSILQYKPNEGLPDFDLARSKQFQAGVFAQVEEFVKMIISRWDNI